MIHFHVQVLYRDAGWRSVACYGTAAEAAKAATTMYADRGPRGCAIAAVAISRR